MLALSSHPAKNFTTSAKDSELKKRKQLKLSLLLLCMGGY